MTDFATPPAPTAPRAEQIAQIIAQGPQPAPSPAPAAAAPATPATPAGATTPPVGVVPGSTTEGQAQTFPAEYVEQLRRENATLRAQEYAGLQGNDRAAVEQFARAIADGNEDYIDNFILSVAAHRGLDLGETPVAEQTPYGAAPAAQPTAGLTQEQVQEMIRQDREQARAEFEEAQRQATIKARVDGEFQQLGVDPNSQTAADLRVLGARMSAERRMFVPPSEVFAEWKRQNAAFFGVTVPSAEVPVPPVPAPNGQPSSVDPLAGLTGDERAIARLKQAQAERLAGR